MKYSRTNYSTINILAGMVGYFFNTILGYICRMVFVHYLPTDYLGVNGLFSNLISMLSLAELGIGGAIGFALYKPIAEDDTKKITSLMKFYGKAYRIIGLVIGSLGILMLPFLNIIIQDAPVIHENLSIIYLVFLFNTASSYFFSYRGTLIVANQRSYVLSGIGYIISIVQSIVQIPILVLTHNYMMYLMVLTVGTLINNIIISIIAKKDYPYIEDKEFVPLSKEEKRSLFVNVKALALDKIAAILVNNTDNLIITYFKGIASVGFTSNYLLLSSTLNSILGQIFGSITASVGNLNASGTKERKLSFFYTINLSNFWLFSWGAIGIIFISSDIVKLCFGEKYVMSFGIPLVIAINFYMLGMQNAVYIYENTLGLFKYVQYITLFTAGINLVLDFILGNNYGIIGIFAATAISRLLTNTWYVPYIVFKYGLKVNPFVYLKRYVQYLFVVFVEGGICYALCSLCHFSLPVNILIKIMICSFVPNIIVYVLYSGTPEGQEVVDIIKRIVGKVIKKK